MRIAFFTDTYHPAVDGVVRSIDLFSDGLRAAGHQVRVFAPDSGAPHRKEGAQYAPSLPFPPYPQYRVPLWTASLAARAAAWKPDVVHCHAMLGMGLAARAAAGRGWPGGMPLPASDAPRVPLVGTFHTMVPQAVHYVSPHPSLEPVAERLSWEYLRWFYQPFDLLIAPSAHLQKQIMEHQLQSRVVPNPVDTEKFRPAGRKLGKKTAPTLLYVGRLAQEKNLDYLLDLAATGEFEKWGARLSIAGAGPYKKTLAARARTMALHGRVRLLGKVPEEKLPALYRGVGLTLLPSKFETQGLVALESMACGTPVAAFEDTALAEVVKPGKTGVRLKEGDTLAAAVGQLQRGVAQRQKLSVGAQKMAQHYSVPACTKQLLDAYAKAMARKRE